MQLPEILHELILGSSRRSDQLLHLFTSEPKYLDICLFRLGLRWDLDADGRAVPRDGHERL
jgi:hypothetical protein